MERLARMFQHTNAVLKNSDMDCLIINATRKGVGKSSFDLYWSHYWETVLNKRQFTLENTVYQPKPFLSRLENAQQYAAIIGDEAIEIFFSRNAMTGSNKKLAKAMAQAREGKNYLIFVNIPDIRMIEGYLRTGEVAAVVRPILKWFPEEHRLVKGNVEVYNVDEIQKIQYTDKGVVYPNPSFVDTFPDFKKEQPMLWKEYKLLSGTHKRANRQTDLTNWDKIPIKPSEIKKELEMDHFIWQNRRGNKKIPYEKLTELVKKRYNRTITKAGAKYKFEHYNK